MRFIDREHAGRELADALRDRLRENDRPLVLALPRGGVPVAAHVAAAVGGELDVVVARKIGAPGQPEFGVGALAEDGPPVLDRRSLTRLGITEADLMDTIRPERAEIERRTRQYRDGRPAPTATDRVVVVVDDGLATGATARAALRWVREQGPRRLILAVPACAPGASQAIAGDADEILCLHAPPRFTSVGQHYADFRQVGDDDVDRVLRSRSG